MIPKKIHYCWFGHNPLPESAQKCIASWRKYLPDYEIIEWNEDNFDVNSIPYTAQAYAAKKYAFVSDFARFKILYEHGGLYFDTDVEVIRPMDDIIAAGPFMGMEIDSGKDFPYINPGLGLAALSRMTFYKQLLEKYAALRFLKTNGEYNQITIVKYTTEELIKAGLKKQAGIQYVADVRLYPQEYFNPLDSLKGKLRMTPNTRSIHWYAKTWCVQSRWHSKLSQLSHRILGTKLPGLIKRFFSK